MNFAEKTFDEKINDIKDISISTEIYYKTPNQIPYDPEAKTTEELIDIFATRLGRLETVSIRRLIEDLTLTNIMAKYLSSKDIDRYFRAKANLSKLLLEGK